MTLELGDFATMNESDYQPVDLELAPQENLEAVAEVLMDQTMARFSNGELQKFPRPDLPRVMPALPTLYTEFNQVNYEAQRELMRSLVEQGIRGFIIMGTTGESPLVSFEEHEQIVKQAVYIANQLGESIGEKIHIVAGGANATEEQTKQIRQAMRAGTSAGLVSAPYYLKGQTEANLLRHYWKSFDAGPGILYLVQGRTAVETKQAVIDQIAKHPNFLGIKNCDKDVRQLVDRFDAQDIHTELRVWSGEDGQLESDRNKGAYGAISVTANLHPRLIQSVMDPGNTPWNHVAASEDLEKITFKYGNPMTVHNVAEMIRQANGHTDIRGFRLPVTHLIEAQRDWIIPQLKRVGVTNVEAFSDEQVKLFY